MCGIGGEFAKGDEGTHEGTVDRLSIPPMAAALAHRGPDEWGFYVDRTSRVALLHTRLSIVGLADGRQPLGNETQDVWAAVNGEIYGYREIAAGLRSRGHTLRTGSDSEVVVHLYEERGEDFVSSLRGEFAIALFDARKHVLYLIRDRFGIKPLYYADLPRSLVFASEAKAIFSHRAAGAPRMDETSLGCMLSGLLLPGLSLFSGVKQVEPGCFVRVDQRGVQQTRYWDLPFSAPPACPPRDQRTPANEEAVHAEFERRFEEAVALRLQADVEVGVFLSGGIDSTAVAVAAARAGVRGKAFTVGFTDPAFDESEVAAGVARATGLEHHAVTIPRAGLAEHFAKSLWFSEIPVLNSHGTAKLLLSKLAGQHVKVVLTGEGADELFAGYELFKHQALLERAIAHPADQSATGELAAFLDDRGLQDGIVPSRTLPDHSRTVSLLGGYPYAVLRAVTYRKKLWPLLSKDFRERMGRLDPIAELGARIDRDKLRSFSPMQVTQYVMFKTDLPSYLLNFLGDRQEMGSSVEGRVPFLDHQLAEMAATLPIDFKLRDGVDKYTLRRYLERHLPEAAQRPKKIFLAPAAQTLGLDRSSPALDHYFSPRRVKETGIFDPLRIGIARQALKVLPSRLRLYQALEGALVLALSVQILDQLFCRDFASSSRAFGGAGTRYDLAHGEVERRRVAA